MRTINMPLVSGMAHWYQTLVATARTWGVHLFSSFFDRISHTVALLSLVDLLAQRAASIALGFSWQQAPSPSLPMLPGLLCSQTFCPDASHSLPLQGFVSCPQLLR